MAGETYRVHTFTSDDTLVVDGTIEEIEYLVVGAGGGGGRNIGAFNFGAGGGGAGQVLTGSLSNVGSQNTAIIIGSGGAGGTGTNASTIRGRNGSDSSAAFVDSLLTAIGGGGGGGAGNNTVLDGLAGASGGGGGSGFLVIPAANNGNGGFGGAGNAGFSGGGNAGGNGGGSGGGGGGAGGPGSQAQVTTSNGGVGDGGRGGDGVSSNITGMSVFYGGGGGGASAGRIASFGNVGGNGGRGGGGNGGTMINNSNGAPTTNTALQFAPDNGEPNTGGGGGGARTINGGNGGSGVVIVRYRLLPEVTVTSSENGAITDGGADIQGTLEAGNSHSITYTIENTGSSNLTLATATAGTLANVTIGSISVPTSTVLSPGATSTFTVTLTPTGVGAFTVPIQFTNNDADEDPFNVTISGTAQDTTPPSDPTVTATGNTNGTVTATGTAEPGSEVTVTFPSGETVTVTADPVTGAYTATSTENQPSGDVTAQAEDTEGNMSAVATTPYTDASAPSDPTVTATGNTDGTVTATGTAEPGSEVTVTFPSEETVTVTADPVTGAYTATSTENQPSGDVTAQAEDTEGNISSPVTSNYIDERAPDAPTGEPNVHSNATVTVTGTAEPGVDVEVTFPNGETIIVRAGPDGSYEATSTEAQPSGTVSVAAIDAAGNRSASTDMTVVTDQTPPTVEIVGAPDTLSGIDSFIVTFQFSEDVTDFELNEVAVTNATLSGFSGSGSTYTAKVTATGQGDIKLQVPASVSKDIATNLNLASPLVTIRDLTVQETVVQIGQFLEARSQLILQHQPSFTRRIDRLEGRVQGGQGGISGLGLSYRNAHLPVSVQFDRNAASFSYSRQSARIEQGHGEASLRVNGASILSAVGVSLIPTGYAAEQALPQPDTLLIPQPAAVYEAIETGTGIYGSEDPASPRSGAAATVTHARRGASSNGRASPAPTQFDIWAEGRISRFDIASGDGTFAIVNLGADYLVNSKLLIGLGVQGDWTDLEGDADGDPSGATERDTDGFGFLITPYFTAKLSDRLYFDGRFGWGRSFNDVTVFSTGTDSFDADRWLVTSALIGDFNWTSYLIHPELRLSYFNENGEAFSNVFGANIPSIKVETGQVEFGPTIRKDFKGRYNITLSPYATIEGIWTFAATNTATQFASADITQLAGTGLRARFDTGIGLSFKRGNRIELGINYDGLGGENFESYGVNIRFATGF
ncbi:MAG: glycine-rich domain-containing protein [Hyphomonadaceae bacterium]